MNNSDILIIVLIIILVILKFLRLDECFEALNTNNYPCDKHPLNTNCTCPADVPQRVVLGQFPMNYGSSSPNVYTCVPASAPEPNTTIWPNLEAPDLSLLEKKKNYCKS